MKLVRAPFGVLLVNRPNSIDSQFIPSKIIPEPTILLLETSEGNREFCFALPKLPDVAPLDEFLEKLNKELEDTEFSASEAKNWVSTQFTNSF